MAVLLFPALQRISLRADVRAFVLSRDEGWSFLSTTTECSDSLQHRHIRQSLPKVQAPTKRANSAYFFLSPFFPPNSKCLRTNPWTAARTPHGPPYMEWNNHITLTNASRITYLVSRSAHHISRIKYHTSGESSSFWFLLLVDEMLVHSGISSPLKRK